MQASSFQGAAELVTRLLEKLQDHVDTESSHLRALTALREYVYKRFLQILESFEDRRFALQPCFDWNVGPYTFVLILGVLFYERERELSAVVKGCKCEYLGLGNATIVVKLSNIRYLLYRYLQIEVSNGR
jgi:hypothetical protein